MIYVKAFLAGGLICGLVQFLMDHTKLLPGRIMVLLVVTGVILGALGIYAPFAAWAGCGATVPLTGIGWRLYEGVKEAVVEHGFTGLFEGGFQAAAVGSSGALVFSYLASLVFHPDVKK